MPSVQTIAEEFVGITHEESHGECAPTIVATFDSVKDIIAQSPPPRRPNRNSPLQSDDELRDELAAWGRVSAEASEDYGWE
jgi:hypothetical protein